MRYWLMVAETKPKIVLVRMDKIGDLVLSLSLDQHPAIRTYQTIWFISEGLSFIANRAEPPRAHYPFAKGFSFDGLWRMVKILREIGPQAVVILYAPAWVGLAACLARIPHRIGRLSQWHSFLFFNRGVRQSRSLSELHESEYNARLLEDGFKRCGLGGGEAAVPALKLKAEQQSLPQPELPRGEYFVVHPGMAGSALNWPVKHYAQLIQTLAAEKPVIITGTKGDQHMLAPLKEILQQQSQVYWRDGMLNSEQLLQVLTCARAVIAPSTGVLHLSAALGSPSLGLYSPRLAQAARRWGPRGPRIRVLTAPQDLPDGEATMAQISPKQVLQALQELLGD